MDCHFKIHKTAKHLAIQDNLTDEVINGISSLDLNNDQNFPICSYKKLSDLPNLGGIQRKSNVTTQKPENELLRIQINTLKANLAKKEMEFKKLKESDNLKRLRIIQLESELATANETIINQESRDEAPRSLEQETEIEIPISVRTNNTDNERVDILERNTKLLMTKIEDLSNRFQYFEQKNSYQNQEGYQETSFQCDLCSYRAISDRDLKRHQNTMHNIPYKCKRCGVEFSDINVLRTHLKEDHRPSRFFHAQPRNRTRTTLHINTSQAKNKPAPQESQSLDT